LARDERLLPEDFRIGPLESASDAEGDDRAALAAAEAFLDALTKGKTARKLLSSGAAEIGDSVAFHLERGEVPTSYRLGRPKTPGAGESAANVRLLGGGGTAEGEIYMMPENRQWLVSDLQVSLADLRVKREKPKDKFFPSSYRWLLGE
jgi:hypothetical protein